MRRGYKFKLEPTQEQAIIINKTLGCCRWVYNNALDRKSKAYKRRKEKLSATFLKNQLPALKRAKPWLAEVDSTWIRNVIEYISFVVFSYKMLLCKELLSIINKKRML